MNFTENTLRLIDELYDGKPHAEITVGVLKDNCIETVHLDTEKKESSEQIVYPAGSIGKPLTASLLARLMSEGKISLDDSLDKYIPGLSPKYYPTIRRLVTHHSGYGGLPFTFFGTLKSFKHMNDEDGILHINPFRNNPDEAKMIEMLNKKKLKDQDYKFAYSNFAFGVLGYILGKLCGSDYYDAMETYCKSVGLENTGFRNLDLTGYDKKGNPCKPWQWERTDIIAPAGAVTATIEDLLKFAKINMSEEYSYLDICHEKHAEGEKTFDQGLAWRLKKDSDISYHVGSAGAFSCILAMDRKNKTAVSIGINYALVDIEKMAFAMLDEMREA